MPNLSENYIQLFHNGLNDETISALELVFDTSPRAEIDEDWCRCANVCFPRPNLPASERGWKLFKESIRQLYQQYKTRLEGNAGGNVLKYCNSIEVANLFEYSPGPRPNGFHLHADCWNQQSVTRQVSVIAYLNDVAEGGETYFPFYELDVHPTRGLVLMFPSSFPFMHRANPPISGKQLIAVTWLHFGPETTYLTYNLSL